MPSKDSRKTEPTVAARLPDGRIVELLYEPETRTTRFAVGTPAGEIEVVDTVRLSDDEQLTPYSPQNNLITTGCVLLPSRPEPYGDKAGLIAEIRTYLRRYVDLSPEFESVAAHYALLSWVHDAFSEVPYLRFRGDYGTGKTRALLTLGAVCYRPFFASGASTVSPIFHILDAFGGTLILDEADFRFSDATAGLTKILNNGNAAGLPVLRSVPNRHKEYSPRAFRVFGPKLVGMRDRFADDALESRFLTEETGLRTVRPDIPLQTPPSLHHDALTLRNKLLTWRLQTLSQVESLPDRVVETIDARFNQVALPLLSLMDDPVDREGLVRRLVTEQRRVHAERARSLPAAVVRCALALMTQATGDLRLSRLADAVSRESDVEGGRSVTAKWLGWFLRTRLQVPTLRVGGSFVIPQSERSRLEGLAHRFGVAAAPAKGHSE